MKLIALKPIGRRRPGDEFEVKASEARVLKAIGKAKDAPAPDPVDAERETLKVEAERLGVEVDGRWGSARLREAIAAAQPAPRPASRFYRRRDMVADES
jgi:hypothetical protein